VPARNEERNLPRLLPSLLEQAYPADRFEVIVVDDQSTDGTPAILAEYRARYPQLRVLTGRPLPDGWKGKPWAMQQGASAARGTWLLFTDADTMHHPEALASTVYDAVAREVDLYTIVPCSELCSPGERLIMPVVFLGIFTFYHPSFVNNPDNPIAIANGQYILIRRAVYDAIGGVEAVRAEIAEDLELGRLVKRRGYRLYITDGRALVDVRMYQNFAEVWAGWRKNVLLSLKKQPVMGAAQLATLVGAGIMPYTLLVYYLAAIARAGGQAGRGATVAAGLSGAEVGALLLLKRRIDRHLGLPPGWTFTFPAGMVLFALILLDSLRLVLSGKGVTWKGRSYTR